MRLAASDYHSYFQPDTCEKRVYLRAKYAEEKPASPYAQVLMRLGNQFEKKHLATFQNVRDLSLLSHDDRVLHTKDAVDTRVPVIYQPTFSARANIDGQDVEVVGSPDFLILNEDSYIIRDLKLARRITQDDHVEIFCQLELYGWLFEANFGRPPRKLEVFSGAAELIEINYDGGARALSELSRILRIRRLPEAPYSPVGWSKCSHCGFMDKCWKEALAARDVALVYGVDQSLALTLRGIGVETYDQLLENFNSVSLSDLKRPRGAKMQRVGKSASQILTMAESFKTGKEIHLAQPELPESDHYVMFDLEGIPPHMDELQKIYLWGVQVYGMTNGPFLPAVAGHGVEGDQSAWQTFLRNMETIFGQFGEIPIVHWHHYEKSNVERYIERFGDPDGTGDRVLENMVDVLPLVKSSIALPLPGYSLKLVEKHVGFKRTQDEYGGDWAIAKYIEAIETNDAQLRSKIMDEILTYNREDLEATWAVFDWFRKKIAK